MPEARYFTPEEANAVLPQVRPAVESMVAHARALERARAREGALEDIVGSNGGGGRLLDLHAVRAEIDRESQEVARCVETIHELGAIVKDLDTGLVDFPARRDEDDVYLCWRLGEPEIGFWHGVEEGFAGRKPLPL